MIPPNESNFWTYVTNQLRKATRFKPTSSKEQDLTVKRRVARRLNKVLRRICDTTTVYPAIQPDGDNGLCATWHANDYGLTISVDSDRSASVIIRKPGNLPAQQAISLADAELIQEIRDHLHVLSNNVKQANPNWLSIYVK